MHAKRYGQKVSLPVSAEQSATATWELSSTENWEKPTPAWG